MSHTIVSEVFESYDSMNFVVSFLVCAIAFLRSFPFTPENQGAIRDVLPWKSEAAEKLFLGR